MSEHLIATEEAREDLLACAARIAEGVKSSDGHAEAMKAVVPQYLAIDQVDLAAELANTVDDPFSRDRLLILVAEKCAELDDDDYALQIAEAVEEHGLQAQARERIAIKKSQMGEFEKAEGIAAELSHPDHIFVDIALRRSDRGETEAARAALEMIQFPAIKVAALHLMAAELIKAEKGGAVELLDEAVATARESEHDEERIQSLSNTASLFFEAGRNDKAIETFDLVRADAEQVTTTYRDYFLGQAALGFLQSGSLELAERTLDVIADKTQMASCLVGYARNFTEKGETQEALEALDEAYAILKSEKETETRDSRAKAAVLTAVAVQYAGFEKVDCAIEIALENRNEDEQYSALGQIAQVLMLRGQEEISHQPIAAIADEVNRMFALVGLSDAATRAGNDEKALELLEEAASMIDGVPQLSSRSAVFNELASRFVAYDKNERARELSLENLETITQIKDESTRAISLVKLSEIYREARFELNDAEKEILKRMVGTVDW
jgi:tetratricopeptide (TPR) repeat protein